MSFPYCSGSDASVGGRYAPVGRALAGPSNQANIR